MKVTEILELTADRILVLPEKAEERTSGGIIVPETVRENERPNAGTIIMVAKGTPEYPVDFKPGQRVGWGKYSGSEFDMEDENGEKQTYLMMRNSDVFGLLKPKDNG